MCQRINYNLQHFFFRPVMFLVTVYLSLEVSLLFFSHPSLFFFFFSFTFFLLGPLLHCSYPGWGECSAPCAHMSLSLNPKGPHTAPGAGREFWRPAAPLISPFPPILVPAFIGCVEDSVFYYHLRSKHALRHPLSHLATRSSDELGLEKHPRTASPYFPSPGSVPALIYHGLTIATINPGIPAFRKWVEDPQTRTVRIERKTLSIFRYVCFPFHTVTH